MTKLRSGDFSSEKNQEQGQQKEEEKYFLDEENNKKSLVSVAMFSRSDAQRNETREITIRKFIKCFKRHDMNCRFHPKVINSKKAFKLQVTVNRCALGKVFLEDVKQWASQKSEAVI